MEEKDKLHEKNMNESQRQPKGRIDIMDNMFFLFCKIRKILRRRVEAVICKFLTFLIQNPRIQLSQINDNERHQVLLPLLAVVTLPLGSLTIPCSPSSRSPLVHYIYTI